MTYRSVRATRTERSRPLPGDELIPNAIGSLTHAITIGRPPRAVWPWLVQMGAGSRAGWYSYDFIDNGRRPSADRIVPELQDIIVGSLFPARPGEIQGFRVLRLEAGRTLVLGWVQVPKLVPMVTWTFVLEPTDDGNTRLITRVRGSGEYPFYGLPPAIGMPFIRLVHFVMERAQLMGIARRAESTPEPSWLAGNNMPRPAEETRARHAWQR
jgi:hypothetical protein